MIKMNRMLALLIAVFVLNGIVTTTTLRESTKPAVTRRSGKCDMEGPTPCKHGEFYADTCNKHAYYQCVWKKPVNMPCSGSLVWNQAIKTCDWP
ncbi:chitin-binding domain protein cbd-1-like [Mytilus trossulus]|uniref:chitin-binding domain protein cbd-1-like n=1 Tax=Mytilus trossulus TaxID=6551 RepID=UPI003006DF01